MYGLCSPPGLLLCNCPAIVSHRVKYVYHHWLGSRGRRSIRSPSVPPPGTVPERTKNRDNRTECVGENRKRMTGVGGRLSYSKVALQDTGMTM